MQPMRPMVPMMNVPPRPPKPKLPTYLKSILVFKAVGCVIVLFLSFGAIAVLNAKVDPNALGDEGRQAMHSLAQILMLLVGSQFLQLVGIVGTWGMKRWGAYVLGFFAMLDIVLSLRAGTTTTITISLVTTLVAAFGIAVRWKDFE